MIVSLFYILVAIACVSFLIFIHELGHYFMARRVGMRVEVFSIGFGRPIFSWKRSGVCWQIGCIPFGGYVKIANAEDDPDQDPYKMPDGYFGKPPIDRIKVAAMGPLVNIFFALLVFIILWFAGGREKSFGQLTSLIGWVDTKSALYESGVRPGDEIDSYNGAAFKGVQEHVYAPTLNGENKELEVKGFYHNYPAHQKIPFIHAVKPYSHPRATDKGILTAGILQPANYIIYSDSSSPEEGGLPPDSPMYNSGIMAEDRIFWIDGELIFSNEQLTHILNDDRILLTVQREGKAFLRRVPRLPVQELRFSHQFKEELADWQFEANLQEKSLQSLWTLPYDISNEGIVIAPLKLIDEDKDLDIFPKDPFSIVEDNLQRGDKIIAIQGTPVNKAYEILRLLQKKIVTVIVERDPALNEKLNWLIANEAFDQDISWKALNEIASSIGTDKPLTSKGNLHLLKPIEPKKRSAFSLTPEKQLWLAAEMQEQRKEIEAIKDPERRTLAAKLLETRDNQLLLGLPAVHDRTVEYNPNPFVTFSSLLSEIWGTLKALATGSLSPRWLVGPVGIVQIVKDNSMQGMKEGLFWLGAISLNLGILNLLPIPILDGGSIILSLVEMITKKRLSPKTLEKIVFPFVLLMIAFFLFLTYNDLWRMISRF